MFLIALPTVYDIFTILFAGVYHLSLDLLGQIEWFDLISETLHMFLIMPLYHIINQYCKKGGHLQKESCGTLSGLGIISCSIYIIFCIGVFGMIPKLVNVMEVVDVDHTILYLRMQVIAFIFSILYDFCFVVFVNIGKSVYIYLLLSVRLLLYIGSNTILIPFWKETGIAASEIISAAVMSFVSIGMLYTKGYLGRPHLNRTVLFRWLREGIFQGSSVLIDNLAYSWMICRIINSLQKMSDYWAANNFIWGFLLLPCVVMAELIKKECNDDGFQMRKYFKIVMGILLLWILTVPGWKWFMKNIMMLKEVDTVMNIVICLTPYYIFYMCSQVFDNYFSGTGNGKYISMNSIIVNGVYYVIMFVLYTKNIIVPDMSFIIRMFGCGIIIHFIISTVEYKIHKCRCSSIKPEKFIV